MRAYGPAVSIRKLLALVVAVVLMVAPAVTRVGEAFAAVPDDQMQMMEMGHCSSPPSHHGDHDKSAGKNCCISMCMAVAVAPVAPPEAVVLHDAVTPFLAVKHYHGLLAEIATPPPRLA